MLKPPDGRLPPVRIMATVGTMVTLCGTRDRPLSRPDNRSTGDSLQWVCQPTIDRVLGGQHPTRRLVLIETSGPLTTPARRSPVSGNWFVGCHGKHEGPYSVAQLQQLVRQGRLAPTDLVWREGMPDWARASSIDGLFRVPAAVHSEGAAGRNPYAASASDPLDFGGQARDQVIEYADYLPRVGAALLDGLFLTLFQCLPGVAIGAVFLVVARGDPDAESGAASVAVGCYWLVGLVIQFLYYVILETSQKQGTWGKQIVGIKVTDLEGNRITAGRAIGRWFAKLLTGCTLGIGVLMPLFTEKKQTLHDLLAGCLALKR